MTAPISATPAAPSRAEASAAAIQHHYDVGNEFFACWLDPSRTYSCALFAPGEDASALETAQRRKLEYHVEQGRAHGAARVLDVGCGWGSLLRLLVERHQVGRAIGLTLSDAQARWIAASGLESCEVRLESWREHTPATPYDAIISIGAFEHFARPGRPAAEKIDGYRAFFERCHAWLTRGGRLSLQTIVYGNMRSQDASPFISSSIFPESDLPRLAEAIAAAEPYFELVALRNDRADYALTCKAWAARLRASRAAAIQAADEETYRRYLQYLKLSQVGFHMGKIGLARMTLARIDRPVS